MEVCNNPEILKIILYIKMIFKYVFILIPIILLLMLAIDFFKNIIAKDESEMKKNISIAIKRIIYCVVLFFVPTIVSLVINLVDSSIDTENTYLTCITNAELDIIDDKQIEYAMNILDDALRSNSYIAIEDALTYVNKISDEEKKEELKQMAENAKNVIIEDLKLEEPENKKKRYRKTTVASDAKYYYTVMESPDSLDDYEFYVDPDPDYVSRAVEVTEEEKSWILSAINHEQGGCKAGAVQTAQTIRDTFLYSAAYNDSAHTIKDVISSGFMPSDIYNPDTNPSENTRWAYEYVFVQGNSFYPKKFVAQNGFQVGDLASLGYYHILSQRGHIDNDGTGNKAYLGGEYPYGYNWGNTMLDPGGQYADYINPNAKTNN